MAKNYRKAHRKSRRNNRKSCRKSTRRASRRSMRGGFQDKDVMQAAMSYKSPFVTNMVRY